LPKNDIIIMEKTIEVWKNKLLDLGKRNKLLYFKQVKRNSLEIEEPIPEDLFNFLSNQNGTLEFPTWSQNFEEDDNNDSIITKGDIKPIGGARDVMRTLKSLHSKTKIAREEQGINILYLTIGLLDWYESEFSSVMFQAPLILIPITLTKEDVSSPYKMSLHEDEIVSNPTLSYKLENDFGIKLPDFDARVDSISDFMNKVKTIFQKQSRWSLEQRSFIGLFSFLKINIFKDIVKHEDKLLENPITHALMNKESLLCNDMPDHEIEIDTISPKEQYQVLDADSSQQEAIIASKKRISFVLQGPPGTGKSQTIANIIAEGLADGKKILFVSEKQAALQVVYNRLERVNLSDFCLPLHDFKVSKKKILQLLDASLRLDRIKIKEEAINKLSDLEKERDELNAYYQQLHQVVSPLKKSFYEVYGYIASYSDVPDKTFSIPEVKNQTIQSLHEITNAIDQYAEIIGLSVKDFIHSPWRNASVSSVSYQLRHDIDSYLVEMLPLIKEEQNYIKDSLNHICSTMDFLYRDVDSLIEMLDYFSNFVGFPKEWINENETDALISKAQYFKDLCVKLLGIKSALLEKYKETILSLAAAEEISRIDNLLKDLTSFLNTEYPITNDTNLDTINKYVQTIHQYQQWISTLSENVTDVFITYGIKKANSISEAQNLIPLLTIINEIKIPTKYWFSKENYNSIKQSLNGAWLLYKEYEDIKSALLQNFEKDFLAFDYKEMLNRFKTDYDSIIARLFKPTFRQDIKILKAYRKDLTYKISFPAALLLLQKLKRLNEIEQTILDCDSELKKWFGNLYVGISSNWQMIANNLDRAEQMLDLFNKLFANDHTDAYIIPEKLKNSMLGNSINHKDLSKIIACFSDSGSLADNSEYNIINTKNTYNEENQNQVDFSRLLIDAKEISGKMNQLSEIIKLFNDSSCSGDKNIGTILTNISDISEYQHLQEELLKKEQELKREYGYLYNDSETDWETIIYKLNYVGRLISYKQNNYINNETLSLLSEDSSFCEICEQRHAVLLDYENKIKPLMDWFTQLFDDSTVFYTYHFNELIERINDCYNQKAELEKWIDYRNNRKKCSDLGLDEFISVLDNLEENECNANNKYKNIFLKEFYRLWMDEWIKDLPDIEKFRGESFKKMTRDFRELDKLQLKIAQNRIRERLINNIPDINSFTSSKDEVGILKRELTKQRKIMPLRKLFASIPNLLLTLRPCLMMSPLSVSILLEADSYNFDIVIFDEASQVKTEDAICAIMRGRQVIITGDNKQLPPTNFFNVTSNDDDDDVDEDDDTECFESVLDEAMNVLPELSLKWHYRSRSEDLIAFSNYKIYGGKLITFPSNKKRCLDNGVEFVYVKDGIYSGGKGQRNNVIEAKKVCSLVFEHFKKYPKRSLGVVSFSQAQQAAIENEIANAKKRNTALEHFFKEDIDEPFFIKNLENVQGDERDTIIFSIGYAKDANHIMRMNFGPLSRSGGERRLNVAITRAKYNIKLVSSIQSGDIDLSKINMEGAKLLHYYIEYAQKGPDSLSREIKITNLPTDSPFEDSVYNYICSKGYSVEPQVGCSGYRIDLGVKNPTALGSYILGIECDGATYHSSKCARERDRLRQDVLESIGWKIYRIWSTDWIKDPITEGKKLVEAIDRACHDFIEPEEDTPDEEFNDYTEIVEDNEDLEDHNAYGFCDYQETDLNEIYGSNLPDGYHAIEQIISTEQPIHFLLLCKRLLPMSSSQKVTEKMQSRVLLALKNKFAARLSIDGKKIENSFITFNDFDNIVPRRNTESSQRQITEIAPLEIMEAMKYILKGSLGLMQDGLFAIVTREFGYKQIGPRIRVRLDEAYERLADDNLIEVIDHKISLK
jgi:very-short-patch-repair endonuclease